MTYNYREGVKGKANSRSKKWLVVPVILLVGGAYLMVNTLSPLVPSTVTGESENIAIKLKTPVPVIEEDRLYVPKIGVDVAIVTGVSEETLEGGAWHRVPQNGDPKQGGNFVLAAHRFNLGLLPSQTRAKSPFYYLDRLSQGDQLYVDYKGQRFAYEVEKRYKVADNDISIEKKTDENKMTLYSCDLRGPKAGREVVEARPIGVVTWDGGAPKIKKNL